MSEWITAAPNPCSARVLRDFRMFAVLGTWMEADVVAATVRNALLQGCDRVYVVDNDSPDDTIEVACAEGAILARSFTTERYDEALRLQHMNEIVGELSELEGAEHIWWLFLDADEFPHGPWGMTLRDYLKTLDERYRVVGTRIFDHYPAESPHYLPGRHPLDFQSLCEELAHPMCPSMHRKHPLQRYDKSGAPIRSSKGFHYALCSEHLYEPSQPAFLHHFPFRNESVTRARLEALWIARVQEELDHSHMLARLQSLDAVYSRDWASVRNFTAFDPFYNTLNPPPCPSGVTLRPWTELIQIEHQRVARWY